MPYNRSNYNFVIDSSFKPFEMQELLTPLTMYKDVYEKQEAAYEDLADKSDKFKYLSETLPEDSQARKIYEGYANELSAQALDLAHNGLSVNNRKALTNLKRRYQGEIGRLEKADSALEEERKLRRANKDTSMLYATDNLSIDNFLDGKTPNLYSVSGDELYKRGAQAAASASSRLYGDTDVNKEFNKLSKYYQEIIQKVGYNPELLAAFRNDVSAIPEFEKEIDSILKEKGVKGNLTGDNYARARESVINGLIDGAIYKESRNIQRDYSRLTAAEAANDRRQREAQRINMTASGIVPDSSSPTGYRYDITRDPRYAGRDIFDFDENGNPMIKPEYINQNYKINPNTGKFEKTKEPKESTTTDPLYKLSGKKELLNDGNGFSYMTGNTRHKYNYVGAISSHSSGKPWQSGNLGEDIPGHLFNWTSTKLSTKLGDYTADKMGDDAHVLTATEANNLMYDFGPNGEAAIPTEFGKEVEAYVARYMKEHGLKEVPNIELVEVPSKRGRNDYLVAIEEK